MSIKNILIPCILILNITITTEQCQCRFLQPFGVFLCQEGECSVEWKHKSVWKSELCFIVDVRWIRTFLMLRRIRRSGLLRRMLRVVTKLWILVDIILIDLLSASLPTKVGLLSFLHLMVHTYLFTPWLPHLIYLKTIQFI